MEKVAELPGSPKGLYERSRTALALRDYRPVWHAIAVAAIMLIALALFYRTFTSSGTLIHQDMTFPTTLNRSISQYLNMWWEFGSTQNIFSVQRLFWSFPLLMFAKVFHVSNTTYIFLFVWGTLCIAGISMYGLAFHFIKTVDGAKRVTLAMAFGPLLAAVIYMYNPWSLNHFWPYFGFPAYALAPLIFYVALKTIESPRFTRVFLLALILTLASTAPICVVWIWLLVLSYAVYYLIVNRFRRPDLMAALKTVVPAAAIYTLLNATWLLPYLNAQIAGKPFVPTYNNLMSQGVLDSLSSNNSVINNIRLISGWGFPVKPPVDNMLWVFLSFGIPILAIGGYLAFRKKLAGNNIINYWAIIFLISIALATGSSFFLRPVYSFFSLQASTGWVIRVPDRWLFYVPMFYALMIGLILSRLLANRKALTSFEEQGTGEVPPEVG
jgi:hypothetical protein